MSFILLTLNLIDLGDIIDTWLHIKKMKVVMLELTTPEYILNFPLCWKANLYLYILD